jgi:hypothetical protein
MRVTKEFVGGPLDGKTEIYEGPIIKPTQIEARAIQDDQGNRIAVAFYKLERNAPGHWRYVHAQSQNNEQFRRNSTGLAGD